MNHHELTQSSPSLHADDDDNNNDDEDDAGVDDYGDSDCVDGDEEDGDNYDNDGSGDNSCFSSVLKHQVQIVVNVVPAVLWVFWPFLTQCNCN